MSAIVRSTSQVTGAASVAAVSTISITETAANPQAGDVRYLFVGCASVATITAPAGWTSLSNGTVGSGNLAVFFRAWASGDGTAAVTLSQNSTFAWELVSVTGQNLAATPQITTNGGSSLAPTATGLTPATADGLLLAHFDSSAGSSTTSFSTPAGMTLLDSHIASAAGHDSLTASLAITSTTAIGNQASATTVSATWRAALVAIPSASTGSTTGRGQFFPFLGLGGGVSR